MTLLAVPLTAPTAAGMTAQFARAIEQGADIIEVRLDLLDDPAGALPERSESGEVIVTLRPTWEGGNFAGDEPERRRLLLSAADRLQAEWIDIEFNSFARLPWADWDELRKRTILSYHDFAATPADIERTFALMAALKPAKLKAACLADDVRDSLRLLRLLIDPPAGYAPADLIALGMGEAGLLARILAGKYGAYLTFAALGDGERSAPGQPSLVDMLELYRFRSITADTDVYGVVGRPVGHSMSPALHNLGFARHGLDKVYTLLPVAPDFAAYAATLDALLRMPDLRFRGASVTIPHKENAFHGVGDSMDPGAFHIGAVNTLAVDDAGRIHQANTDCLAIREAARAVCGDRFGKVLILGAGGAARAALAAVEPHADATAIANRTFEKAAALATEFRCSAIPWEARGDEPADLIINCTAVGMNPKPDESPLPADALRRDAVIFDTVYNPLETKLLREARAAGRRTIDGLTMFVNQAVAQFELWTGRPAPREEMTEIVRNRLMKR